MTAMAATGKLICFAKTAMAATGKLIARLLPDPEPERDTFLLAIFFFITLSCIMARSDFFWNKFLPKECHQIVSRAEPPVPTSKRELYARLGDSILIDEGKKMAWLERSTGKMGYMLSARDLSIIWGGDERYWRFVNGNGHSRFQDFAELIEVYWFEIRGKIDCRLLSPNTNYRVVFVLKFGTRSDTWREKLVKFSVTTPGGEQMELNQCLIEGEDEINLEWMEVIGGEFTARPDADDEDDSHIEFSMVENNCNYRKCGLHIDGVRIQPMET